ncbi:hypothetical protein ACSL103130_13020 [Actinomyces slackii]
MTMACSVSSARWAVSVKEVGRLASRPRRLLKASSWERISAMAASQRCWISVYISRCWAGVSGMSSSSSLRSSKERETCSRARARASVKASVADRPNWAWA